MLCSSTGMLTGTRRRTSSSLVTDASTRCSASECALFRRPVGEMDRNKLDGDWLEGYYLGMNAGTADTILSSNCQLCKSTTVRRRPNGHDYDKDIFTAVTKTYYEYIAEGAPADPVISVEGVGGPIPEMRANPTRSDVVPRRAALRQDDFEAPGYTAGCPGCVWMQLHDGPRRGHTEACGKRMEDAMETTEAGGNQISRALVANGKFV